MNSSLQARVAELVDAADLKSAGYCNHAGSIPAPGTSRLFFVLPSFSETPSHVTERAIDNIKNGFAGELIREQLLP